MTAKAYLRKIGWYQEKITQRKFQLKGLGASYDYISGIDYSRDKVQTSPHDTLGDMVARALDDTNNLTAEVIRLIGQMEQERNRIITQIQDMDNPTYAVVLFKMYVERKDLTVTASEMGYEYGSIANLHTDALRAFSEQYADILTEENPDV